MDVINTKIKHLISDKAIPSEGLTPGTLYFKLGADNRIEIYLASSTTQALPVTAIVRNVEGLASPVFSVGDSIEQAVYKVQQAIKNTRVTIKQNNVEKGAFTLNQDQSGGITINLTDTTYTNATQSKAGLMSANDKVKLDNAPATIDGVYTIPAFEVFIGSDLKIDTEDLTVTSDTGQQYTFGDPSGNAPWTFHGVADNAICDGNGNVIATSYPKLANGKIPSEFLPGSVDDVLEYFNKNSFPASGEAGKIYVDLSTNKTYRWGGSAYIEISASLAIGETDSSAFSGARGLALENDMTTVKSKVSKIENGTTTVPKASTAEVALKFKGEDGADYDYTDITFNGGYKGTAADIIEELNGTTAVAVEAKALAEAADDALTWGTW